MGLLGQSLLSREDELGAVEEPSMIPV